MSKSVFEAAVDWTESRKVSSATECQRAFTAGAEWAQSNFLSWVSADDELPPLGVRVLVRTITNKIYISGRLKDGFSDEGWHWMQPTLNVEKWTYLPE